MTAADDAAERKNRHLAYAQRVQTLTMRLVEATAALAEQVLAEQVLAEQGLAEPAQDTQAPEDAPRTRTPDHILEFVRLTRALNQTIALENRIANQDFTRHTRPFRAHAASAATPGTTHHPDPRRPLLRQAFHQVTKSHPDRAERRREIDHSIDQHLAADPAQSLPAAEILQAVSQDVDLSLDFAHLSDEILGMPGRPSPYRQSG